MAFPDATITIRPGENGGPALVILDDSYKEAQGNFRERAGVVYNTINSSYFGHGTAIPNTTEVEKHFATVRAYKAIIEAVVAGRGVKEDNEGHRGGAILMAYGNATSATTAAGRTAKPAPIAVLAVEDDDDPPFQQLNPAGVSTTRTIGFGTLKVLT